MKKLYYRALVLHEHYQLWSLDRLSKKRVKLLEKISKANNA